jgi:hypothetical protein
MTEEVYMPVSVPFCVARPNPSAQLDSEMIEAPTPIRSAPTSTPINKLVVRRRAAPTNPFFKPKNVSPKQQKVEKAVAPLVEMSFGLVSSAAKRRTCVDDSDDDEKHVPSLNPGQTAVPGTKVEATRIKKQMVSSNYFC